MMILYNRLSLLIVLLRLGITQAKAGGFRPAVIQEGIVALTMKTFDNAIHDVANPLWMIEFHAPWCGVCQRFAETLRMVANAAHGRMAVGTVDCTVEEVLCKERYQITGYPTLMYAHYGRVEDSPLQHDRSLDDFLDFARRMSLPSASVVQSMEEANRFAKEQGVDGVAFVAYHPDTNIGNSDFLDTFREASKRLQRYSSFAVLQPFTNEGAQLSEGPFMCRVEEAVPTRCYTNLSESNELDPLLHWIERERIPTVASLTATGLEELGRKGRVLCVAIYRDADDAWKAEHLLREFATKGAPASRARYYYGIIDASKYEDYLQYLGFDASNKNPQIFLTNLLTKEYWQNATYGLDITSFLDDVEQGVIPSQAKHKNNHRRKSLWTQLKYTFKNNQPWSSLLIIGQCICFLTFLGRFIKVRKSLRPPYPRSSVTTSLAERPPFVPNAAAKKTQ